MAGHDFHYLWAANRALELLSTSSGLAALSVEGFDPDDSFADKADQLLGADLVEYFGGATFDAATRVVVLQLKYGTRTAQTPWSASRLGHKRTASGSSTISRLGELFRAVSADHPIEVVVEKLRIALVSNRPATTLLTSAVEACKDELTAGQTTYPELLEKLSGSIRNEVALLRKHAQLDDDEFLTFVRLLDFSQCGTASRSVLETGLVQAARKHFTDRAVEASDRLYRRIMKLAMPEHEGSKALTRDDLLAIFEVTSVDSLLPVPSRAELPPDPIPTNDVTSLVEALRDHDRVLAHGGAGIGKTTTLLSAESRLPPGSIVLYYDCFGGGSYLDETQPRHLTRRAIFQLTNQLAFRAGTPLMVERPIHDEDLFLDFQRRIEAAAAELQKKDQLLVIAIDAADNAAYASNVKGDRSFIPGLWDLPLPPQVRIVMSARSHRVDLLQAPPTAQAVGLSGFDAQASATSLRKVFPNAADAECEMFHEATNGNPRVQFYVLGSAANTDSDLESTLAESKRTPGDIFDDVVETGLREVDDPEAAARHLADLVSLARPITLDVFGPATGLDVERAERFCAGLVPGVRIEEGGVSFRDEEFEKHVQDRVGATEQREAHSRLATHFLEIVDSSETAAIVVAEHLYRAARFDELIEFVLNAEEPRIVSDPVLRSDCTRRRIHFALRAALDLDDFQRAFQLGVQAGEAAMSSSAISTVVERSPALAMRFGDPDAVSQIYLNPRNGEWRGSLHIQASAMFARNRDLRSAKEHFDLAYAWLREARERDSEDQTLDWHFSISDIAAGAEAIYWRRGLGAALKWLSGWRPETARRSAQNDLARELVRREDPRVLARALRETKLSAIQEAAFAYALAKSGTRTSARALAKLTPRLERALRRQPLEFSGFTFDPRADADWAITIAESAAKRAATKADLRRLLRRSAPQLPLHVPHQIWELDEFDLALRRRVLEAQLDRIEVSAEDVLPKELRSDEARDRAGRDHEELRRYMEVVSDLLPVYRFRARALTSEISHEDAVKWASEMMRRRVAGVESRWRKFDSRFAVWQARLAEGILLSCGSDAPALLNQLADAGETISPGAACRRWLDLAERAAGFEVTRETALSLADKAARRAEETSIPAGETADLLLASAEIAEPIEPSLGADYFRRAVLAASGIDDDSVALLRMHNELARRIAGDDRYPELVGRMTALVEAFVPRVTENVGLPFVETVEAGARLSPEAAFAALSRWEDLGRCDFDDGIRGVVSGLAARSDIEPSAAVCLLRLAGERRSPVGLALPHLDRLKAGGSSRRAELVNTIADFAEWIRRDLSCADRPEAARELWAWCVDNSISGHSRLSSLRSLIDLLPKPKEAHEEGKKTRLPATWKGENRRVPIPLATPDTLSHSLSLLGSSFASDAEVVAYLVDSASNFPASQRVDFLNSLTQLSESGELMRWSPVGILQAVTQLINGWSSSTLVQNWASTGLSTFVENNLGVLIRDEWQAGQVLTLVAQLPFEVSWAKVLLRGLYSGLDELTAGQLFVIAEVLAGQLELEEQKSMLEWSITRLEGRSGLVASAPLPELPKDFASGVAALLYSTFGNEDRAMRWRGLHVARGLTHALGAWIVAPLAGLIGESSNDGFHADGLPFLWVSAQHTLWLYVSRLSAECPEAFRPYASDIYSVATSTEFPHAAIRQLARQSAINLQADSSTYDVAQIEALTHANQPAVCLVTEDSIFRGTDDRIDVDTTFNFDSMDTIPYWYAPLARALETTTAQVAITADHWIADVLGVTDDDVWKDRRELRRERDWGRINHHHGTVPPIETLRSYAEYHGMLLAAGELLDQGASTGKDGYRSDEDAWTDWLSGHVAASEMQWTADLRAAVPDDLVSVDIEKRVVELRTPKEQNFRDALSANGEFPLYAWETYDSNEAHASVRIRSAFVPSSSGRSLARALQSASPDDFYLPYEDSDGPSGQKELSDGEFELRGAVRDLGFPTETPERFDPLARIDQQFPTIGERFLEGASAQLVDDGRQAVADGGSVIGRVVEWSDRIDDDDRGSNPPYSAGTRVTVAIPELLMVLATADRSLLVDVEITHQRKRRYDEEDKYQPPNGRVYLLQKDGSLS